MAGPNNDWMASLPTLGTASAPARDPGWLGAGLSAGWHGALGSLGSTGEALGALTGWQGLRDAGAGYAASQQEAAAAGGNPALEQEGFGSLRGVGYQIAKAVPSLAGALVAGTAAAAALPAELPLGLGAAAATLPRFLIGRGAATAADLAAGRTAAGMAGETFAKHVIGATVSGLPLTIGGNVEAYKAAHPDEELGPGAAAASIGLGIPEAVAGGIAPAAMRDAASAVGTGVKGYALRLLKGGAVGAGITAPQMGFQSLLTDFMDPNKTVTERAQDVVQGALGGAVVGGALGAGMKAISRANPGDIVKGDPKALLDATNEIDPNTAKAADAMSAAVGRGPPPPREAAPAAKDLGVVTPGADSATRPSHGPYATLPEDQLRTQADELLAKTDRTKEEDIQFSLLQDELGRRTQPGRPVGEGVLNTPEEMGQRVPVADAYLKSLDLPKDSPLRDNWNVTNEPELVNHVRQVLADSGDETPPKHVTELATKLGVLDTDGKPVPVPEQIATLEARNADIDQMERQTQASVTERRTNNRRLELLRPLEQVHEDAAKLDEAARTPAADTGETAAADVSNGQAAQAPVAENDNAPQPQAAPDTWSNTQKSRWSDVADLAVALKDTDPDAAARAEAVLARMKASDGKAGIRGKESAASLADEFGAQLDEYRTARDQKAQTGVSTDVPPEVAAQLAPAPLNPFIKDGSRLEWANDNVPGAPPPEAPAEKVAPPPPQPQDVAQHVDDFRYARRSEAMNIAADANNPDAKAAQAALDKEASGKKQDRDAVVKFINQREARLEAEKPQGPWTGKDPKDENVVGTSSVPTKHVALVDDMMNAAQMGNVRVMVGDTRDVSGPGGDTLGLNGSYKAARDASNFFEQNPDKNGFVQQFGPNKKDFMIFIRPGLSDAQTLTEYGHEVGHIAEKVLYNQTGDSTRAAIQTEFQKYLAKVHPDMPAQDLVRMMRNKAQADVAQRDLTGDTPAYQLPNLDHYGSFGEWFADNVSRWFTSSVSKTEPAKPKTAVDRFFKGVADKWKDIVASITGNEFVPNEKVQAFMNSASADTARMWAGDADGTAKFSTGVSRAPQTPPDMLDAVSTRVKGMWDAIDSLRKDFSLMNVKDVIRRSVAGYNWVGNTTFARIYNAVAPAFGKYNEYVKGREALQTALNQPHVVAWRDVASRPLEEQKYIQPLIDYATRGGNWFKGYADQSEAVLKNGNQGEWMRQAKEAQDNWNQLNRQFPDGAKALMNVVQANQGLKLMERVRAAEDLMKQQAMLGAPIDGAKSWLKDFANANAAREDPAQYRAYMSNALDEAEGLLQAHSDHLNESAATADAAVPESGANLRAQGDPITRFLSDSAEAKQQASQLYFHAGRHGDYIVASRLMQDAEGKPSLAAVQAFQDLLEANGYGNIAITKTAKDGRFMIRVENAGHMANIADLVQQGKGTFIHPDADIVQGRPDHVDTLISTAPYEVQQMLQSLKAPELPPETPQNVRESYRRAFDDVRIQATRQWLDMQGTTLNHMLQKSQAVSGYSTDFYRNGGERSNASVRSVANSTFSGDIAQTLRELSDQVQASKRNPTDPETPLKLQAAADEIVNREEQKRWTVRQKGFDSITKIQHAFTIGMSPAYVLTLMGQIATLSWPELAKTHGYMGAAQALARAAIPAFHILMGSLNGPHMEITKAGLDKLVAAGKVDRGAADMILRSDNRGDQTQSTFTHLTYDLARGADPTRAKLQDWATLLGRTSETLPRILTALAAHDLNTAKPVQGIGHEDFISKMVNGSQFDWGAGTNARAVGQLGVFGPASRVMLAFTGYQIRMIQKYYEEMHAYLGKQGATPEEKAQNKYEAGKFLMGHIAATVAIAGTMGLPGAGWFAAAADGIGNLVNNSDDFDVKASYRSFLTDTFGPAIGEVLAKGMPRAAGVDMTHEGEQELLPFTRFVEDKRKLEDKEADWLHGMAGSGTGMAMNAALGVRDLANGDYMQGVQKFLPGSWLKGAAQAFRLSQHGYEDRNGVPIPLNAGAKEILMTAMGLKPAAKAEYDDELKTMQGLEAMRSTREKVISRHMQLAIAHGDTEGLNDAIAEANEVSAQHPGLPPLTQSMGNTALRNLKLGGTASGLGMLIGQKPNDIELAAKTRYGNWRGMQ